MGSPSIVSSPTGAAAPAASASAPDRARVKQLAQEFESMMLLQVMRQLRETVTSMGGDDEGKAVGGDMSALTDTIDGELARYLTKAGGFGLSGYLQQALKRQQDGAAAPSGANGPTAGISTSAAISSAAISSAAISSGPISSGPISSGPSSGAVSSGQVSAAAAGVSDAASVTNASPTGPVATPAQGAGEPEGEPLSYQGAVTSPFGWRTDPIVHTARFHGGIDIRAAYGQEVPAAGSGTVTFAGEQGGYGMTVVVEHPSGLSTRYAHLSATEVRAGDQIAEGQAIGRAGQSGRATGPHVHLELTRGGQRLDPTSVVRSAAFKRTGLAAD